MAQLVEISAPMGIHDIYRIIPQRYPFVMVDKVIELHPSTHKDGMTGRTIITQKNVSANEPHFVGHFPGSPLVPGVLQLEGMAQTCALASYTGHSSDEEMVIAGVNKARFRKQVIPGDILLIKAIVKKYRTKLAIFHCVATVDGEIVAEAELMATISKMQK